MAARGTYYDMVLRQMTAQRGRARADVFNSQLLPTPDSRNSRDQRNASR